jgi:hypothetical protein
MFVPDNNPRYSDVLIPPTGCRAFSNDMLMTGFIIGRCYIFVEYYGTVF